MPDLLDFVQRHTLLVAAFFALLALVVWTELRRFTKGYQDVRPQQAVRLINDDDPLILDVREANEVAQGKIRGACHIPMSKLAARLGELDKERGRKVLVYCRSGQRSGHAAGLLKKHGFEEVYNLQGGILAWESDNLPVVKK